MMEEIKHLAMVKFLREHSTSDLFMKWQTFSLTQKFFWSVVYPLYQENLRQKKLITVMKAKLGIIDFEEIEPEEEPILKELVEEPKKTEEMDECPYCDKMFKHGKIGFSLRMHIARFHKDEFREWEKEHGE